jgi:putative tricarboxylic transport membrane protein
MRKIMRKKIIVILFVFLFLQGCSKDSFKMEKIGDEPITIVAPSSIGGGWDVTARAMQSSLTNNNIINQPIKVVNIVGAGGEKGWKYVSQQKGQILAINSSLIITNHLLGVSKLTYNDFTPIATLAAEWEVVLVRKDAEIKNAIELIASLEDDSRRIDVGVSPKLGNNDQLSFILAIKTAELQPKELDFYVYENSARVIDDLLNNEIDFATMSLSEAKKYYDSNQVHILAVSSDERLKDFPEIPTWKEQGVDVVLQHWRGVMGPPGMKKSEIEFWDNALSKMVETEEWKQTLKTHNWTPFYKSSQTTKIFLKEQSKFYEMLMSSNLRE